MSVSDVSFVSDGVRLAANLYLPDTPGTGKRPAVVVSHPGSGVKEQAAGLYARLLSEQGFVAVTFDAAFQGASAGEPRGLEDPAHRIEDIKTAVTYLTTRPEVDADNIGVLGICASGGYALAAAAGDHRLKAIATVSGVDIAKQFKTGADGAQDPIVFQSMLDAAASARTAEAGGAAVPGLQLFPETAEQAATVGGTHAVDGFEYYCTPRAMHPRSAKSFAWASVDRMAMFDALTSVPLIGQRPLLLVVGREAVTAWMAVEVYQRAVGPKELFWIAGATHVDLYDKPQYVEPAIEKLTDFYHSSLGVTAPSAV